MMLARIMLRFWSNFAATGDPNGASLPDWPRYDAQVPGRIGFLTGGRTEEISARATLARTLRAVGRAVVNPLESDLRHGASARRADLGREATAGR